YAAFRADDFLRSLFGKGTPLPLHMEVYDGNANAENLLHQANPLHGHRAHLQAQTTLPVADRQWTLRFASPPEYEQGVGRLFVPLVPLAGTALTLVLYYLTGAQVRARTRAERAAAELAA